MGYKIKLLGVAQMTGRGLEQRMQPCLVPDTSPLGQLSGGTNMIVLEGDAVGQIVLRGAGAGAGPTASAVLADVCDIARGFRGPVFGLPARSLQAATPALSQRPAAYYLRMALKDKPGALAKIAAVLGEAGVSIDRMRQYGHVDDSAPVLIVTHKTTRADIDHALDRLRRHLRRLWRACGPADRGSLTATPAFLGVETSLTERRWIGPGVEAERASEALHQQTGLPMAVCQVLARRGVPAEEAEAFLAPALRDLLPDPRSLRDMETAATRFLRAVKDRQRIAVFADYDVDGGSSAALLLVWLREMGHRATLYVPDRIDEGYGPNDEAMAKLAAGHDLIICVDCGTLSHGPIAAARDTDVIVLDHHLGGETLPDCLAVVNPNRQDEDGALAHLCAAAVVFLMLVEAGRQLRAAQAPGPDLMALLDLVALATVADVAPLIGVNRAFVRQGLQGDGAARPCRSLGARGCRAHGHGPRRLSPRLHAGAPHQRGWARGQGGSWRATARHRRPA